MSTETLEAPAAILDAGIWTDRIFSDGWVDGATVIDVTEPATGNVLGTSGAGDAAAVARAATSAKAAQQEWAAASWEEREGVLRRAADLVEVHADELAGWLVREAGAIMPRAAYEVHVSVLELRAAAALLMQPIGLLLPTTVPGRTSMGRRIPIGVVGVIAPWNFPLILALRSVAPALAAGNGVVLKADPNTPICGGVMIARIFEEAGLPSGVLHVMTGGPDVGEAIVADPNIGMVSFTGSTKVGRIVGESAGRHLKKVALELGGKNALIVLEDADVDAASSAGAWGSFLHQGQICMAAGRHIVHENIADAYIEALSARAARLPVGNPATDEVALGPIINQSQADNVQRIVDSTIEAGATAATGGQGDGLFFPATVLRDVLPNMAAYDEEIFGPVAPVITFSNEAEAIAIANDTDLGLSAAIQTGSPDRGLVIAGQLHAGMVHVNDQTVNDEATAPFTGLGSSGNGTSFGSPHNLDAFSEMQWVTVRDRATPFPF